MSKHRVTPKDVGGIIETYLKTHGFAGLYSFDQECSCMKDDLAPCDGFVSDCTPGIRVDYDKDNPCPCGDGCDYHIEPAP